jgi:hypothetical protein
MPAPAKRLLWVDDEIDLLRPHLLFVQGRGYHVDAVANGDDAIELVRICPVRPRPPGRADAGPHGYGGASTSSGAWIRCVPVVMVTKSEEDRTMTEAIGGGSRTTWSSRPRRGRCSRW